MAGNTRQHFICLFEINTEQLSVHDFICGIDQLCGLGRRLRCGCSRNDAFDRLGERLMWHRPGFVQHRERFACLGFQPHVSYQAGIFLD